MNERRTDESEGDESRIARLFAQWQAGDTTCLEELAPLVQPWMYAAAHAAMGSMPRAAKDSADLVQDIWVRLIERLRFAPQGPGQFRALIERIVRNEVVDRLRRLRTRKGERHVGSVFGADNPLSAWGAGAGSATAQPLAAAAAAEGVQLVTLALQFLADEDRHLMVARDVEGKSWAEVAAELDMPSEDSARVRHARVRPRLAILVHQLRSGELPAPPRDPDGS